MIRTYPKIIGRGSSLNRKEMKDVGTPRRDNEQWKEQTLVNSI